MSKKTARRKKQIFRYTKTERKVAGRLRAVVGGAVFDYANRKQGGYKKHLKLLLTTLAKIEKNKKVKEPEKLFSRYKKLKKSFPFYRNNMRYALKIRNGKKYILQQNVKTLATRELSLKNGRKLYKKMQFKQRVYLISKTLQISEKDGSKLLRAVIRAEKENLRKYKKTKAFKKLSLQRRRRMTLERASFIGTLALSNLLNLPHTA